MEALEEGKRRGLVSQEVDSAAVAWEFLSLGLSLDVICLLGLDRSVDRQRVERWADFLVQSLRPSPEVNLEEALQMVRRVFPLWQPLGRDMVATIESHSSADSESERAR
jgi:hypothetical protein